MNKMTRKKYLFIIFIVVGGISFIQIAHTPPYYYQSRMGYFLLKNNLNGVLKYFENNDSVNSISLNAYGKVVISGNDKFNFSLDEKEKDMFDRLIKSSIWPIWKSKGSWFFMIGTEQKFNRSFDITYVHDKYNKQTYSICDDQYKMDIQGSCRITLGEGWFLQYNWMKIQPIEISE